MFLFVYLFYLFLEQYTQTSFKFQCDFYSASINSCLLLVLKNQKHVFSKSKFFGASLADLSKVFQGIRYDLLIAIFNFGASKKQPPEVFCEKCCT